MNIHIGLNSEQIKDISNQLKHLLADSYTLLIKTHQFHWNVTGPHFKSLHELFENLYTELFGAVDEVAERIRALGQFAPGSYQQFIELTEIKEETGAINATEMLQQLIEGQEQIIRICRKTVPIAESASDQPTLDLLTRRMHEHEKTAWMLRSMLE